MHGNECLARHRCIPMPLGTLSIVIWSSVFRQRRLSCLFELFLWRWTAERICCCSWIRSTVRLDRGSSVLQRLYTSQFCFQERASACEQERGTELESRWSQGWICQHASKPWLSHKTCYSTFTKTKLCPAGRCAAWLLCLWSKVDSQEVSVDMVHGADSVSRRESWSWSSCSLNKHWIVWQASRVLRCT